MAGRKDNGDGSITKRVDGRWEARISLPNGKRKSFYGKTKEDVKRKLKDAKRIVESGASVLSDKQTVGQFLTDWLVSVKPHLESSSVRSYSSYMRNHILPSLGHIPLQKLTAQHVQLFYATLFEKGLSSTTIHVIHTVLKSAIEEASRLDFVPRNVLHLVKPPQRAYREMLTLSEDQVNCLLGGVRGDWFEALYIVAVMTGMREMELLGLRWKDIDFEKGSVLLQMGLHMVNSRLVLGKLKTSYSRRRIALTKTALEALRLHRIKQNEWRLSLGDVWDDSLDLVFPNTVGRLMSPSDLRGKHFKKHLRSLNLPDMRFHDLRHTCATLLLSRGVNVKVVSEMLGHSNVAITLRVYGHVLPHMQEKAVNEMEDIFSFTAKLSSDLSS